MQMRCKMRPSGWISLKIISFQVLPVFQIGINYFWLGHFFQLFFFLLFLSCFPTLSLRGVLPQRPSPVEGEGDSPVARASDCCPLPLRSGVSPSGGTESPRDKFCPRKNGTPQSGLLEIHARVEQVFLFQVDRKHRQEFRQSSFPFSGRTYTSSPSEYERFPPTGEKPQDPWGPS